MIKTLSKMLQTRSGYRTESFSGSNVRNIRNVINYEVVELNNMDIIDYVRETYNISILDLLIHKDSNIEDMKKAIKNFLSEHIKS